jgi:beta-glucosidase
MFHRKGMFHRTLLTSVAALLLAAALAGPVGASSAATPVWLDTRLPPETRATDVVAAMTLDEKITELHGIQDDQHRRYVPGVPRLGIPPLRVANGPAGVGPADDPQQRPATALPAPISLASTFDTNAAKSDGGLLGSETQDLGHNLLEAPDINIARVPVSGRTFEGFGEDPYLAGQLAAANIQGIQRNGTIAEVKHFAANNQEQNRLTINELVDDRTLHEIYLPQFEAAVKDGHVGSVMCAYPQVNGEFACQNSDLLQNVLHNQWGFSGFVQSDFGATHDTAESAVAGLDLEMPTGEFYGDAMKQAVTAGMVSEQMIDGLLIRRFAVMMEFGLFERPLTTSPIPVQSDGAVSRKLAEDGSVLLRNENAQLPLSTNTLHSIAVVGPYAGQASTGGGGSSHVDPTYTVSPVQGLQNRVGAGVHVDYSPGATADEIPNAVAAAKNADVAVVMVGDDETEGVDRPSLALSGVQDQLVEAVTAANPHTVVVVKSGGPVLMPWKDQVPSILEAWYPGQEDGNAVAALLFGDVNPSGKLPITFPAADGDVPAHTPQQYPGVNGTGTYSEGLQVGYRWYDSQHSQPLYPFGYGLSYTSFAYSNLTVSPVPRGGYVDVSVDVTNTGQRSGADVAQVYVTFPAAAGEPPQQLKGFQRVTVAAGQRQRVNLRLDARAFSTWNSAKGEWTVADGTFTVRAGDSSTNLPLSRTVTVSPTSFH